MGEGPRLRRHRPEAGRQAAYRSDRGLRRRRRPRDRPRLRSERGAELGLINRLAEPGQALDVALELAGEVAANAPLATAASKSILNRQGSWDDETFWAKQGEIVAPVFTSADAIEGATAFSEKREPNWRGR